MKPLDEISPEVKCAYLVGLYSGMKRGRNAKAEAELQPHVASAYFAAFDHGAYDPLKLMVALGKFDELWKDQPTP